MLSSRTTRALLFLTLSSLYGIAACDWDDANPEPPPPADAAPDAPVADAATDAPVADAGPDA